MQPTTERARRPKAKPESTRHTGNRLENSVEKELTARGWWVQRAVQHNIPIGNGKYATESGDFFGLFDIMAIHPGLQPLLIQVTDGTNRSHRRRKIEAESANLTNIGCVILVVAFHKSKAADSDATWWSAQQATGGVHAAFTWLDVAPPQEWPK